MFNILEVKLNDLNTSFAILVKVGTCTRMKVFCVFDLFVWFDSLRPINNLSVKQGRVFLG